MTNLYTAYATYFVESTGLEPMSIEEWLAIPESERPGADD